MATRRITRAVATSTPTASHLSAERTVRGVVPSTAGRPAGEAPSAG